MGGANRWKYDSFVNWEFFPSVDLPILVYFKETQTPQDQWDVGPGQWANGADALASLCRSARHEEEEARE